MAAPIDDAGEWETIRTRGAAGPSVARYWRTLCTSPRLRPKEEPHSTTTNGGCSFDFGSLMRSGTPKSTARTTTACSNAFAQRRKSTATPSSGTLRSANVGCSAWQSATCDTDTRASAVMNPNLPKAAVSQSSPKSLCRSSETDRKMLAAQASSDVTRSSAGSPRSRSADATLPVMSAAASVGSRLANATLMPVQNAPDTANGASRSQSTTACAAEAASSTSRVWS
mmetsp:Transcript_41628/g.128600  ORF Transcript_41628/g.128600 Transcript_41628/m.128600 type:complete len:226 (-) Transcript_41628:284-961(-)